MMFNFDGTLLLAISIMFGVLVQRDYAHSNILLRLVLYAMTFFAFCCSMHAFGIILHTWATAYWARIGLDLCLVAAVATRLLHGRFVPAAMRWPGRSALHRH